MCYFILKNWCFYCSPFIYFHSLVFYSNVLAGHLFGIPLRGTHSHAYVSSYMVSKYPCYQSPMNKCFYICSRLLSPEHLVVSQYTVVALVKQFFTALVAKLHVISGFKLEDFFPHHTSPQIMKSKSMERVFGVASSGAICSNDAV